MMLSQKTFPMRKNNINLFSISILLLFIVGVSRVKAQYIEQYPISPSNGDKMIEIKNFQEAVRQFSSLLKEEPSNEEYKFKLAIAYTYSQIDQKKGLEILEKMVEVKDKPKEFEEVYVDALHRNYRFNEAERILKKIIASSSDPEQTMLLQKKMEQIKTAQILIQRPLAVSFENLGKYVNSDAPDYLPLTTPDESIIVFSTRRTGVVGNLYDYGGYRTADIFICKHKKNKYSRARSIGSPNTYGNEHTAGQSEHGSFLIYNVNSEDSFDDLFVSEEGKRSYMPPKVFDSKVVNQKTSEVGATLTNDGTKMYFCSNREGGLGGYDLYSVQRLPNGEWGEPKNMGAPLNTHGDETYPYLLNDGMTLYFSSNGHASMGGLDLFKSERDNNGQWGTPKNLGHPINTPNDDKNISFAKNKRYAYLAANREDSYGDLDIYRITFHEEKEDYTVVSGRVLASDSATVVSGEVYVEVFSTIDESLYGSYVMSPKNGKYLAILPPGRYRLEILDVPGFKAFSKEVNLLGKNDFQETLQMDIVLKEE